MRNSRLCIGVLLVAGLCLAPAALSASERRGEPRLPEARYASGPSASHASNLLQQIQLDSKNVKDDADQLSAFTRTPFLIDWRSDGGDLTSIRTRVNDMDRLLAQLRIRESSVQSWQRQAIDGIAATLVNLSDTTQAAVTTLNQRQDNVYYSNLRGLAKDMSAQAEVISRTIENQEKGAETER